MDDSSEVKSEASSVKQTDVDGADDDGAGDETSSSSSSVVLLPPPRRSTTKVSPMHVATTARSFRRAAAEAASKAISVLATETSLIKSSVYIYIYICFHLCFYIYIAFFPNQTNFRSNKTNKPKTKQKGQCQSGSLI